MPWDDADPDGLQDPKFRMDTPRFVARSLRKAWSMYPTDDEITKDIKALPQTWTLISQAKGTRVDSVDNRHGRRAHIPRVPEHLDAVVGLSVQQDLWRSWLDADAIKIAESEGFAALIGFDLSPQPMAL
jgi:hypothetical protein